MNQNKHVDTKTKHNENDQTGEVQEKKMICISCPLGCRLTVSKRADTGEVSVKGNACARGIIYGQEEMLAPKRVVTATVKMKGFLINRVPVKTDGPLEKQYILPLLDTLYSMEFDKPITRGEVILENVSGTDVNVIASRSIVNRVGD